ncbi:hypothetical protein [Streptomyces sp. SudanB182_2057]|uniref:hypothetical protein n=1 Tax=Streptomyces sp. SudanB182_2057 TaxID=3035281 RepID=UPI003F568669
MITTLIAVVGTLLGAALTGAWQHLTTVSGRRDRDRQAQRAAVAQLLGAATAHRAAQFLKHVARREGEPEPETGEARASRYAARTAVTQALTAVRLSGVPAHLQALAVDLVAASVAVGDAPSDDRQAVDAAGAAARVAHEALETAAAQHLA